jgi:hypothetical protein
MGLREREGKNFNKKKWSVHLGELVSFFGKSLGGCKTVKRDSVVCGSYLIKRALGFLRPART